MTILTYLDKAHEEGELATQADQLASLTQTWGDQLQKQFNAYQQHAAHAQCWLLLDPAIADPADLLGVDEQMMKTVQPIRWMHHNLVPAHRPYLLALPMEQFQGDLLLKASLQHAQANWQIESLQQCQGHSVCGWLFSEHDINTIIQHLGVMAVQTRPLSNGTAKRTLLRYWDPSILPLLWPLLDTVQQTALLGPIDEWHLINRESQLQTISNDTAGNAPYAEKPFVLSLTQWQAIQNIGALNVALLELPADAVPATATEIKAVQASLMRARQIGIHDPQDLAAYAQHALVIHPDFDQHPLITDVLKPLNPQTYYRTLVSTMPPQDWQTIRQDCLSHSLKLN
jgi:hypothetical protein